MGFPVWVFYVSGLVVAFCLFVILLRAWQYRNIYLGKKEEKECSKEALYEGEPVPFIDNVDQAGDPNYQKPLETTPPEKPERPPRRHFNVESQLPASMAASAIYGTPPTPARPHHMSNPPYNPQMTPQEGRALYPALDEHDGGNAPKVVHAIPKQGAAPPNVNDGASSAEDAALEAALSSVVDLEKRASLAAPEDSTIIYTTIPDPTTTTQQTATTRTTYSTTYHHSSNTSLGSREARSEFMREIVTPHQSSSTGLLDQAPQSDTMRRNLLYAQPKEDYNIPKVSDEALQLNK